MKDPSKKDSTIFNSVKEIIGTGIAAAFMTEDAVKSLLKDLPLPKDIASGLIGNAKHIKEDFIISLRQEVKDRLSKVDPSKLVHEIIDNYDFEIKANISLRKKENHRLDENE